MQAACRGGTCRRGGPGKPGRFDVHVALGLARPRVRRRRRRGRTGTCAGVEPLERVGCGHAAEGAALRIGGNHRRLVTVSTHRSQARNRPGVVRLSGISVRTRPGVPGRSLGHWQRLGSMNRLAAPPSPYLLQHADNPVDWWEWWPEAFAEAQRRDVPVLLSVGYAACHWCHVMAHESFEDDGDGGVHERALRQRQGGPRGAAGRRRGLHAGDHRDDRAGRLADDGAARPPTASRSSPAPTSRTGRGTGSRRSARCSRRSPTPGATAATR